MKPKLIDYSIFKKKSAASITTNVSNKTQIKNIPSNSNRDFAFLLNIIIILIIIIGGFLLYKRYKDKDVNNKNYTKKIENLYNTINNYG